MDPFTIALLASTALSAAGAGVSYLGAREANSANRAMNAGQMIYQTGREDLAYARQVDMNREAQAFNEREAYRNRDFLTYMSNTAYQRSRRDMMAAGLNPILAAYQGGASTPSASAASIGSPGVSAQGAPSMHRMENALGPAVSSALQGAQTVMGLQEAGSRMKLQDAQAVAARAQATAAESQAALNSASAITEVQRAGLIKSQRATEMVMPSLRAAQTGASNAQAVLAGEQARTEPDRRGALAGQAYRDWQAGRRQFYDSEQSRQEVGRFENWGPRSQVTDAGASAEAIQDRIGRLLQRGLLPHLQ